MSHSTCPRCGTRRHPGESVALCPTCVLTTLTGPLSSGGFTDERIPVGAAAEPAARLEAGDQLGPYRIERLLGRGGTGEVYEASHIDLGRRVALKVLTRPIRRPQDRERFLAEGRMAAAFNHPNSVYVFETRDVGGLSTIAMELLSGETLQDRVRRDGTMPVRDAVNAVLQVIAGLEAALSAGVLHRDIKPANCLIDRDGTVKIGDFGLSISPGLDGLSPSFAGTPQFAAPEQLRGEPLDHRADIYAVGATLWFLLTGRAPYDADSLDGLLDRISAQAFDAVESEDWPRGLLKALRRCLAPAREERYQSYAELRAALQPFAASPARSGTFADRVASTTLNLLVLLPLVGLLLGSVMGWPGAQGRIAALLGALIILGGYWGALQEDGAMPWLAQDARTTMRRVDASHAVFRAALRLLVFIGPILVGAFVTALVMRYPHVPRGTGPAMVVGLLALGYVGIVGRAGSHQRLLDLLSARPVDGPVAPPKRRDASVARARNSEASVERLGPFEITGRLAANSPYDVLTAWDPQLERQVWIHRQPPGAPPASQSLRSASRISRLRWLQGSRTSGEAWDAYEAPDGRALLSEQASTSWSHTSVWLTDLATELVARSSDEPVTPIPGFDHAWITASGRGVLLEFPAPITTPSLHASELGIGSPQQWLARLAHRAMAPSAEPLPLSVSECLRRLAHNEYPSLQAAADALASLRNVPDVVDRQTRWMSVALSGLVAQLMADLIGGVTLNAALWLMPSLVAQGQLAPLTVGWLVCATVALVAAVLTRGGFWLSALGMAVVTKDGREVSRTRAAVRAAVAWSWVPLAATATVMRSPVGWIIGGAAVIAAFAIVAPRRSLQGRLTGTYLVPR